MEIRDTIFKAASEFANLLRIRFEKTVPTTEDSIRYTFFAALLRAGLQPHEIVLEHRHDAIVGAEIDTFIPGDGTGQAVAIEFKYDRAIPSGRNQPKTMKAGAVVKDMGRLRQVQSDCLRFFIYVTDQEMATYWRNERNGLSQIFSLRPSESLDLSSELLDEMPATFRAQLKGWSGPLRLVNVCSEDLPRSNYLRMFEVI
jgi:hypothetical protein